MEYRCRLTEKPIEIMIENKNYTSYNQTVWFADDSQASICSKSGIAYNCKPQYILK